MEMASIASSHERSVLVTHVWAHLWPIKSIRLYAQYLEDAESCVQARVLGRTGLPLHPVAMVFASLAIVVVHQLYLTWRPSSSLAEAMIHLDVIGQLDISGPSATGPTSHLHLSQAALGLLTMYYYQSFYTNVQLTHLYLVRRLLFGRTEMVTVESRFQGTHVRLAVRSMAQRVLGTFSILFAIANTMHALGNVNWLCRTLPALYQYSMQQWSNRPFYLCLVVPYHLTLLVATNLAVASYAHACCVAGSLLNIVLYLCWIRVLQAKQLLYRGSQTTTTTTARGSTTSPWKAQLRRFERHDIRTVELVCNQNPYVGLALFAFMLFSLPVAAFLSITMLLVVTGRSEISPMSAAIMSLLIVQQFVVMCTMHLAIALVTRQMYAPAKRLFSIAVSEYQIGDSNRGGGGNDGRNDSQRRNRCESDRMSLRDRTLLARTIARLHTKRKISFTYGPFGFISLSSCCKCILIFGELLMYAYTFVTKRDRYRN